MNTLTSLTNDLSIWEDPFTYPISTHVAVSFPFNKVFKDLSAKKCEIHYHHYHHCHHKKVTARDSDDSDDSEIH